MPPDEDDGPTGAGPLADLLFGLVAVALAAVAGLLPTLRLAAESLPVPAADPAGMLARAAFRLRGEPVRPFRAGAAGLHLETADGQDRLVPTGRILDDEVLARELRALRDGGRPLLLLIAPDGHESAFLFETVAALHGPPLLAQVRLDAACGFAQGAALAASCRGGGAPRP